MEIERHITVSSHPARLTTTRWFQIPDFTYVVVHRQDQYDRAPEVGRCTLAGGLGILQAA